MTAPTFQPSPGFKGLWIPACILFDDDLSLPQRIILAEIYQLQEGKAGECFAGNAHFGKLAGIKERRVRGHLAEIEAKGFLRRITPMQGRTIEVAPFIAEAIKNDCRQPISALAPDAPEIDGLDERPIGDPVSRIKTNEQPDLARQISTGPIGRDERHLRSDGPVMTNYAQRSASGDREPGNENHRPVSDCLAPRQCTATEYTMREQLQNTTEPTIIRMRADALGTLNFSLNDAGTHIMDDGRLQIVSKDVWDAWVPCAKEDCWGGWDEASQLERLAMLVRDGIDGDAVVRECLDSRHWHVIEAQIIPDALRTKYDQLDRWSC